MLELQCVNSTPNWSQDHWQPFATKIPQPKSYGVVLFECKTHHICMFQSTNPVAAWTHSIAISITLKQQAWEASMLFTSAKWPYNTLAHTKMSIPYYATSAANYDSVVAVILKRRCGSWIFESWRSSMPPSHSASSGTLGHCQRVMLFVILYGDGRQNSGPITD